MSAKSDKQYKFMAMISHGKDKKKDKNSKSIGPSKEVAEEMVRKTPAKKRSTFMKGKK